MKRRSLRHSDEWETQPEVHQALQERRVKLGRRPFGVDLFATSANALLPVYFTKQTNALAQDWLELQRRHGPLRGNPPYSDPHLSIIVPRGREEAQQRAVDLGLLVPASTSSKWFGAVWGGLRCVRDWTVDQGPLRGRWHRYRAPGGRLHVELLFFGYRLSFLYRGREITSGRGNHCWVEFLT